jgi:hypothetical protein
MAKVKAVFYVPLKDNDGRSLADEIAELEIELYVFFVGWTFQGYVKGAFPMSDGSKSLDESAAYSVLFDEARIDDLENLLRAFKAKTTQEAIYLEIQRNVDVRFVQ